MIISFSLYFSCALGLTLLYVYLIIGLYRGKVQTVLFTLFLVLFFLCLFTSPSVVQ